MSIISPETRIEALRKYLSDESDGESDRQPAPKMSAWDGCELTADGCEYLVLSDEEADRRAAERIRESLWACSASFLRGYIPALENQRAAKAWAEMVGKLCEDANPLVEALLGDRLDEAIEDIIASDGRGNPLAGYDGEEHEVTLRDGQCFYIYRTN